jgi:hypothetical protein
MAIALTTGARLSAPTKKSSLFTRFLHSTINARQRQVDRAVEQHVARHLLKLTDDAERQIERFIFTRGQ